MSKSILLRRAASTLFAILFLLPFTESRGIPSAQDKKTADAPRGKILWFRKYRAAADETNPSAQGIAVDKSGNAYVTGFIQTLRNDTDYLTIKLDPKGRQLWSRRYNGPSNDVDRARAVAVDPQGHIIVAGDSDKGTGITPGRLAGLDIALVKYDSRGRELWICRYNSPTDGEDRPMAMAIDRTGASIVVGTCAAPYRQRDGKQIVFSVFTVLKISSAGKVAWSRQIVSPEGGYAVPTAVVTDQFDNIYATGIIDSPPRGLVRDSDIITIKYSPNGAKLWERRYATRGRDRSRGIGMDRDGNVYVGGDGRSPSAGKTREDFIVLKYSPRGALQWVTTFDGGSRSREEVSDFAVDDAGNSWLGGKTINLGEESATYLVAGFDRAGKRRWVDMPDVIIGGMSSWESRIQPIGGGGAVVGLSARAADHTGDIWTVKYDRNGRAVWQAEGDNAILKKRGEPDDIRGIVRDNRGNILVAGDALFTKDALMVIKYAR